MSKVGDIYCFWNEPFGVWMAFQVLKPRGESEYDANLLHGMYELDVKCTGIVMLDWFSPERPTKKDAVRMGCFVRREFGEHHAMSMCSGMIDTDIPRYCTYLGNYPRLCKEMPDRYSSMRNMIRTMEYAQRWYAIPEEKRTTCRSVIFAACTVKSEEEQMDLPELVDRLTVCYPCAGMLDLSHTYLSELRISLNNLDKLILPETMHDLYLFGTPKPDLEIVALEQGRRVHLHCSGRMYYLKDLKYCTSLGVELSADEDVDIAACVQAYPRLYYMEIYGKFGTASGFSALKQLPWLRQFHINGMYGFHATDFPTPRELPNLDYLTFMDVPKEALVNMRAKYKRRAGDIEKYFRQGRTDEWIKENRDNPLRAWQGREQIPMAKAKKAALIYKKLRQDAHMAVESRDMTALEPLFREAAEAFYALDKKGDFLETVELEELYTAANDLISELEAASNTKMERESLLLWFDGMLP